jgi:hypothetical protein
VIVLGVLGYLTASLTLILYKKTHTYNALSVHTRHSAFWAIKKLKRLLKVKLNNSEHEEILKNQKVRNE